MIELFIFTIFVLTSNFVFKKFKILSNQTGQIHQKFSEKETVPLTGGTYILTFLIYYYYNQNLSLLIFFILIYLIGLMGDLSLIKSPVKRVIIQGILVILFIIFMDLKIYDLRTDLINNLLEIKYFNFFFISFCFLVLINGSNFIDGNNGLSLGYFLIIYLLIISLIRDNHIQYEDTFLISFAFIISILLFFNYFNFFFLGDSGIYLLAFVSGYLLIDIYQNNLNLSPYYVALLLWYPCFEILFSMIRKFKQKHSPLKPDINHLHQLIFYNLKKQFNYSDKLLNSTTGILINLYNLISLCFFTKFYFSTITMLMAIFINLLIYLLVYYFMVKLKRL